MSPSFYNLATGVGRTPNDDVSVVDDFKRIQHKAHQPGGVGCLAEV